MKFMLFECGKNTLQSDVIGIYLIGGFEYYVIWLKK